ncbi:MAG: hypothetical protein MZW92_14955 [Comamonadaceae bacterium]|nr:hypothetical protein [Comamonadaceae bacterium]
MANNVKLGPGGIREIEFVAQVFQLIRGGRDPALQIKPTLKVLALLAERGILDPAAAANELAAAYDFLRRLEHRLQYLDDHADPQPAGAAGGPGTDRARPWASASSRRCWRNWTTTAPRSAATSRRCSPTPAATATS